MKACGKRPYNSPREARSVCRRTGNRLRVYRCRACRFYHVANADKGRARERPKRINQIKEVRGG